MAATSDAAKHLYWSKAPSNTPPSALTAEKAKAQKADADVSDKEWTPLCALLANPRARPIRRCSHVLFSTRARADKWGQKYQKIILTIFVPCLEDDAVKVDVKPKALSFRAERVAAFAGNKMEKRIYTLSLEFLAEVDGDSAFAPPRGGDGRWGGHPRVPNPRRRAPRDLLTSLGGGLLPAGDSSCIPPHAHPRPLN